MRFFLLVFALFVSFWLVGATTDLQLIPGLSVSALMTLDQLESLNRADPNAILTGKLDLRRVGVFGISLGGIVVGEACRREQRLRACLVMDAAMPTDVVRAGLRQPSMWITRDATSMRLERQRAGGWPELEIQAHQTSMRAVYEGLSGAGYFVRVPGMFHGNFTDIAIWTPMASLLGVAGPINPQRAHDIVNAYTLAFFDRHVYGRPAKLLEGPAGEHPDAVFESRVPCRTVWATGNVGSQNTCFVCGPRGQKRPARFSCEMAHQEAAGGERQVLAYSVEKLDNSASVHFRVGHRPLALLTIVAPASIYEVDFAVSTVAKVDHRVFQQNRP